MPDVAMHQEFCEHESIPVQLEPFIHQVGGHSGMFRFNDSTVCKPLVDREHYFYKNLPANLKEFLPEYRGEIEVQLFEDDDGYVSFIGFPTDNNNGILSKKRNPLTCACQSCSSNGTCSSSNNVGALTEQQKKNEHLESHSIRLLKNGSIEVSTKTDKIFHAADPKSDNHSRTQGINPWSLRCHKQTLSEMKKKTRESDSCKFILLENVAAQFHIPCILDLKMGTRQHGDDVSEAKIRSHTRKCQASTSSSIGVRVCGMQVHHVDTKRYICHNKYYGRSLTVEGFKLALSQFLQNGHRLRADLLSPILCRLLQLQKSIENQDTFRFYSSSLLIMYEGSESPRDSEENEPETQDIIDNSASLSCSCNRNIDVRMIDFAHSTHQGFSGDKTVHRGPDRGYLFGLKNLIHTFMDIKKKYCDSKTH